MNRLNDGNPHNMEHQLRRASNTNRSRRGHFWTQLAFALVSLATLSGCYGIMPPVRFNAEVKSLTTEAEQRFPVGSSATEFEAWFASKSGGQLLANGPPKVNLEKNGKCEMRSAYFRRQEGCMNIFIADYCVDDIGKLMSIKLQQGGYC